MKIIEGREGRQGISEEERRGFTSIVRVNVLSQFKLLLQICKEENIPFPKQARQLRKGSGANVASRTPSRISSPARTFPSGSPSLLTSSRMPGPTLP